MPIPQFDFSIVVPSFGRPDQLAACLAALTRISYPPDRFEVIVVDDGSVPALRPDPGSLQLTLIRQENAGPAAARNAGAAQARGVRLAFTDDDCCPAPEWLAQLAEALDEYPDSMVGGKTINALTANPFAAASQTLVSYLYQYYNRDPVHARFFTSNNIAVPAERFRVLGGFETDFRSAAGEDRRLCEQWRVRGWPMVYAPSAVVFHSHQLNWRGFWRQHFGYGRAAHRFHRRRVGATGAVQLEPWRFYRDLITSPWAGDEPAPLRQSALLMLSQVANASGYYRERLAALKFWGTNRPADCKPDR